MQESVKEKNFYVFEMKKPNFLNDGDSDVKVVAYSDILQTKGRKEVEISAKEGNDENMILLDFENLKGHEEDFCVNVNLVCFVQNEKFLGKYIFGCGKIIDSSKEDFGMFKFHVVEEN